MTNRIGLTIATLLAAGTVGLTGLASAAPSPAGDRAVVRCPSACPLVYEPVTCKFSDGSVRTFSNRCFAGVFACRNGLKVISCRSSLD